jgi:hypothetical protein
MTAIRSQPLRSAAMAALLALAACTGSDREANLAEIDNELIGNDVDPALTSALEDQILVDPALTQQSNAHAIRPPEAPPQAQYPVDRGSSPVRHATRTAASAAGRSAEEAAGCGAQFQYGAGWARRLPAAFPAYPGWRVTEAAGSDTADCRMRVVTFRTADGHERVIGWYRQVAERGGYSAEHQVRGADHVLGGVNARTDGAFYLIVTPLESGSEVALLVNNGR